jgi:hypothetical protein
LTCEFCLLCDQFLAVSGPYCTGKTQSAEQTHRRLLPISFIAFEGKTQNDSAGIEKDTNACFFSYFLMVLT